MRAEPSRRQVFKVAAGGALMLSVGLRPARARAAAAGDPPAPNVFIRIAADDIVTVIVKHLEMGQGVATGLATIVAEELDADWAQMRYAFAPVDTQLYNNLFFGPMQGTGTSNSIANSWTQLREAGAAMRAMLVSAAAQAWKVPATDITVRNGRIEHRTSGRAAGFGVFAAAATGLPVPAKVVLKDPKNFTLVGRALPRLDVPAKTDGTAGYSIDVRRPGQLTAVVLRPPRFAGRVRAFDPAAAMKVKGVVGVVEVPTGVAIIAGSTWAALKGRKALKVTWDFASAENRSTDEIMASFKALARQQGITVAERGDPSKALATADRVVEAEFQFPYLAHAPLEPVGATIQRNADGGVTIWTASQSQTIDQQAAATALGLKPEQVAIHTLLAGGSFGRRSDPRADYISEAAHVLKAFGGERPIHLFWTREDDLKGGLYRPMAYHKVRAVLGADGQIDGWDHVIVSKSITAGTGYAGYTIKNGADVTTYDGADDMPYGAAYLRTRVHQSDEGVPVLWWRAVSHSHTAHVVEAFVDELAQTLGEDPVQFRLRRLEHHPELAEVLRLAAECSGWGAPMAAGRGRGVALHHSHGTQVATVAEVTMTGAAVRVDRVVVAVNCGIAINPDNIRAQFEGGAGFMLSSVLRNQITLKQGEVQQSNFGDYEPTRISEMPRVEVHIVPSARPPSGVGEPAVTCVGPAIVNAVFAASGKRHRSLPLPS